jgi:uncharacterized protein
MPDQPADQNFPATLPPNGVSAGMADSNAGRVVHAIFIGPNGLRAGWRLLIYILLTIACLKGAAAIAHAFGLHAPKTAAEVTPINMTWSRAVQFLCFLLPAFVMSKIERRPAGDYGLPARGAFGKEFWEGVAVGFLSLSLLLVMLRLSGAFYFGSIALGAAEALKYAALWGLGFLMVGFFEEYVFRGYVQFTLTTAIGFWPTAVLLSFLFAYAHYGNEGETLLGLIDVFLAGIVLCAMLIRTGNLWLAVGFHFAWDWAESYFYGVADSGLPATGALFHPSIPTNRPAWLTGGTVGPEGSIFSCITEILLIIFILWRFRQNRYPAPEPKFIKTWKIRLLPSST